MSDRALTLADLQHMKRDGQPIVMLTAYDASFARLVDRCGVDCVLVGDSLGQVIQGHDSTLPVTVDAVAYHVGCVARGLNRALLIADLPFLSYATEAEALQSSRRLMQAGARMVKLEGGLPVVGIVERLTALGVPVCGHLGLTPQSVHQLSGYRVQGREPEARGRLLEEARALEAAGAGLLVLECVPDSLGAEIAAGLSIPVIGIGAGVDVDGQVLVLHDLLGLGEGARPRFVRDFCAEAGTPEAAVRAYVQAVRTRRYPAEGETYGG
ncbi:MAG: 3-methyl-2-oxobutanoate hydroxymethyltransferase [Wenzhouxiangellaceae bacterium]